MPPKKLSIQHTFCNARNQVNQILSKYDSPDLLLIRANGYKRTKNPLLREACNNYKNI